MTKEKIRHIISAFLIFAVILIVYRNDMQILVNEALVNEALTHILLAPFFATFLYYTKRNPVKASVSLDRLIRKSWAGHVDTLIGVVLCLISFLIYWYGSRTFYPLQYHILSLPVFVLGIILILSNLRTALILLPPTIFLFFLIPPPMELLYSAGGSIATLETQIAYTTLKTFGLPVQLSTTYGLPTLLLKTITKENVYFTIDVPCSGLYSIMAFVMLTTFLIFISKAPLTRRLLIFPLGFIIFEALNIARIVTIVSIAHFFGEETAMIFFHPVTGIILTFIGMLLTLSLSEKALKIKFLPKTPENSCPKCKRSQKNLEVFCKSCGRFLNYTSKKIEAKTLAKIVLLLLVCTIITFSVNAPTFAIAKNSITIGPNLTAQNSTKFLPKIEGYSLKFLYRDVNYEKIAGQEAALIYAYFPVNQSNPTVFVSVNVANTLSNLHSWEVCLITWQTARGHYPLVNVLESEEIQLLENPPLIARYLAFKTPQNYTQLTFYWFERIPFETTIVELKYVRISLIIITYRNPQNYERLKTNLLEFGEKIVSHLEPIKTQSFISLGISALQILLAASIILIILIKTSQYIYETNRRKRNLKIFSVFASEEDKVLLKTLLDLGKQKGNLTMREMAQALRERGKLLKSIDLIDKLKSFEDYGFVSRELASNDNVPRLVWKVHPK